MDLWLDRKFVEDNNFYLTFFINNKQPNYLYLRHEVYSGYGTGINLHISTEDGHDIVESGSYIYYKGNINLIYYMNKTIYFKYYFMLDKGKNSIDYPSLHSILMQFTNYVHLFPIPNKINEPLFLPALSSDSEYYYAIYSDISEEYGKIFYRATNLERNIEYIEYIFLETNDYNLIYEHLSDFLESLQFYKTNVERKGDYAYFSISKNDINYMAVLFAIYLDNNTYIMKTEAPNNSNNNKNIIVVLGLVIAIALIIIIVIVCIIKKKKNTDITEKLTDITDIYHEEDSNNGNNEITVDGRKEVEFKLSMNYKEVRKIELK